MIDAEVYTYVTGLFALPVEQDRLAQTLPEPAFLYQRRNEGTEVTFCPNIGLTECIYDCAVKGIDIDAVRVAANTVKTALNGFRGTLVLNGTKILGAFVGDASDEYIDKSLENTDEGFHLAWFNVRFIY